MSYFPFYHPTIVIIYEQGERQITHYINCFLTGCKDMEKSIRSFKSCKLRGGASMDETCLSSSSYRCLLGNSRQKATEALFVIEYESAFV